MSTMVIRMKQNQVEELGECIENGLHQFGRAMSIYEDMKRSCDMSERRYYPEMRRYDHPREEDWNDRYMNECRYTRY